MNFGELRKGEVQLLRIHLPRTSVNKGAMKKGQSPRRSSDPSRSSAARALLLGRRALVGRRGRFNRHSWQLCLGGLVVARLVAGRALARRDERVDERERRGGRCTDQHCGHYQDKKHPAHGFHLPSRSLRCSHGSKQEVLGESSTCTIFGELRRIPLPRTPVNKGNKRKG